MTEQHKLNAWYTDRQEAIALIIKALLPQNLEQAKDDEYAFWKVENPAIEIGEFDNCRESGFTYSLLGGKQDMVFCVYEHRNSDSIIINGCMRQHMKAYGPYNGDSKWDYLATFSYGDYTGCAERLAEFLLGAYKGDFNESLLKDVTA
jgi:hypothetical protein